MSTAGVAVGAEPHPCRFFNGRCIDCGRAYGEPRALGVALPFPTPTDEQLRSFADALGMWVEPHEAARESGVPVELDIPPEEAARHNAVTIATFREAWANAFGVPASPLPEQVTQDPRIAKALADNAWDLYARADGVTEAQSGAFLDRALLDRAVMTPEQEATVRRGCCPKCMTSSLGTPIGGGGVQFQQCLRCHSIYALGVTGRFHQMISPHTPPIPEEPQSPTTTGGEKEHG